MELGYLIVKKRTTYYKFAKLTTLVKAKIELGTTNARLTGTRGKNSKVWFVPACLEVDLTKDFNNLDSISGVIKIK